MSLDTYQKRILKYAYKRPRTVKNICDKFSISQDELSFLINREFEKYINYHSSHDSNGDMPRIHIDDLISCNLAGRAFIIENRHKSLFKILPIVISIVALIKSFTPELVLLWKQLAQLLK